MWYFLKVQLIIIILIFIYMYEIVYINNLIKQSVIEKDIKIIIIIVIKKHSMKSKSF